jgi:hypothetical protein
MRAKITNANECVPFGGPFFGPESRPAAARFQRWDMCGGSPLSVLQQPQLSLVVPPPRAPLWQEMTLSSGRRPQSGFQRLQNFKNFTVQIPVVIQISPCSGLGKRLRWGAVGATRPLTGS